MLIDTNKLETYELEILNKLRTDLKLAIKKKNIERSKPKNKVAKTSGLDWLYHSFSGMNGSRSFMSDVESAEAFIDKYVAYKTKKKESQAIMLVTDNYEEALVFAKKITKLE